MKICIVASTFNKPITENLTAGALKALEEKGLSSDDIEIYKVPGAYEIPVTIKKILDKRNDIAGIVALGCLIKGDTAHFEYISGPVSDAVMKLSLEYTIPIGFGVLTCYTPEQAYERSLKEPLNAESNKGYEAAEVMFEMIELLSKI